MTDQATPSAEDRFLIAEDEPLAAERLRMYLEGLGHRVVGVAHDGRDAVAQAASLAPDLVFLDIKMPIMDGLQAADEIMGRRPVPIMLVTGHVRDDLIERAMTAGVMGYLVKPVNPKDRPPAIRLARSRFKDLMALRTEVTNLKQALLLQRQIGRAKGVLVQRLGLSESGAHQRLSRLAQQQGCTLTQAAARVIEADQFFADLGKI